jgi:hypothetical protein
VPASSDEPRQKEKSSAADIDPHLPFSAPVLRKGLNMVRKIRLTFYAFGLVVALSASSQAQQWELGAQFGLAVSHDPAISGPNGSAQTGFPVKAIASVVWGENLYQYFSGEFRYMFRWGGPKLTSDGTGAEMSGYANLLTYEILVHMKSRESRFRPFVAGGSGIKIYTGTGDQSVNQPLANVAALRPVTQVEPAISVGGGVKYLLARDVQFRIDFRTYMTPSPNDLIRPVGKAVTKGWSFDLVPMLGISYVF